MLPRMRSIPIKHMCVYYSVHAAQADGYCSSQTPPLPLPLLLLLLLLLPRCWHTIIRRW